MAGFTKILPKNYQQNKIEYKYKVPLNVTLACYLNTEPVTYAGFSDLIISIYDGNGTEVESGVATLQKVDLSGGTFRIYWDDFVVYSLTAGRVYYPVIYDTTNGSVLMKLNCFECVSAVDAEKLVRIEYRNSSNILNYDYEDIPTFYNIIYLNMNVVEQEADYDLTQYFEASTGLPRNQKSQIKDSITLEGFQFDSRADSAMKGISMHSDIIINLASYSVKEGWKREFNNFSEKSKGVIVLYSNDNNSINLPV
jgi:hypothetical protein